MEEFDLEKTKENHNLFIFGTPKTSIPIDESGKQLDYGFNSELGRIHYDMQEDGTYLIKINSEEYKKFLTLENLTNFFYNPSKEYFDMITQETK